MHSTTLDLVQTLWWAGLRLAIVLSILIYTGLVLMNYSTEGARYRLKLDPARPARSAEHLAVWLGARAIGTAVHAARVVFDALAEASAEVGEWFIHWRGPDAEARFHAHFL